MTLPIAAVGTRGSEGYRYAEVATLLGPETIGETGDNRYETLYGRPYALVLDAETRRLRLFRGAAGGGSYEEVTTGLPAILFDVTYPEEARRFTAAFDQSARLIVAYELDGSILVTRWTGSAYVQNVTFAGVDPALLIDATLADPRGYPTAAADGWSVREAYDAGIRVTFEWLAGDPVVWLESAIPDSDVVLFYLTPDRLGVRARVQRQLYATVQELADLEEPVVLDRAIALLGRYELLLSDELGDVRSEMLVSGPYIGDFLINPSLLEPLPSTFVVEDLVAAQEVVNTEDDDELAAAVEIDPVAVVGDTAFTYGQDGATGSFSVDDLLAISTIFADTDSGAVTGALAPDDPIQNVRAIEPATDDGAIDAAISPEAIRVQTV